MKLPSEFFDPVRRERRDLQEEPAAAPGGPVLKPNYLLHAVLFVSTFFTTTLAGAFIAGVDPLEDFRLLARGLPFSISLMAILTAHEMGHYFASRRFGVMATLPYFIPVPPLIFPSIGTFGAFIKMVPPIGSRSAILNIGLAGPAVGFVFAVLVTVVGLGYSTTVAEKGVHGLNLGGSLIFAALTRIVLGPVPEGMDVLLHPMAFAGWLGFFVTALNLIPIGQMDGGHIVYAVAGERRHRAVSLGLVPVLAVMGLFFWPGWLFWAVLASFLGVAHPPVRNPHIPLYADDRWKAAGALVLLVLTFVPVPFAVL